MRNLGLDEEVRIIFAKKPYEPLDAFNEISQLLKEACDEHDLTIEEEALKVLKGYHETAMTLMNNRRFTVSATLLLEAWNTFGERQRKTEKRVYRAKLAFLLAQLYERQNDIGTALRWNLHIQADDILGKHPTEGGAGRQDLRTKFGMSEYNLEQLNTIGRQCRTEAEEKGWSHPSGFCEEVVRQFAIQKEINIQLMAETSSLREFPLSKPYFEVLFGEAKSDSSAYEKGKTLESLATYLLLLLPGCVPRQNVWFDNRAFEMGDVIAHNLNQKTDLNTELLGRHILVECKNWDAEVGPSVVGYFCHRMQLAHAKLGIILSRKGETGNNEWEYAKLLIQKTFHETGNMCIVFNYNDMEKLLVGEKTFWGELFSKIEELRFGKPS